MTKGSALVPVILGIILQNLQQPPCVLEKIFQMTPCQNPHFILASFMLSCSLLETSLITAGVQAKLYFRTPKQSFRVVTITEMGVLLPLPHMDRGQTPGPADDRAGKKSFDLQSSLHQSAWAGAVRATSVTDWLSDSSM